MDKISEMLTKIRNAQMAGHKEVIIDFSNLRLALAKILEKEGFLGLVSEIEGDKKMIKIILKYKNISRTNKIPVINEIKKISKSGMRVYVKKKDIKTVKNRYGTAIFSTSKGLMTGEDSRKMGLGGEYICQVW